MAGPMPTPAKPPTCNVLAGVGHRYAWHKRVPALLFLFQCSIEKIKFTGAAVNIGCLDRGVVAVHVD